MADVIKKSDPYVLPKTTGRYVTEVIDKKNYTIIEISEVDAPVAFSVDGVLTAGPNASANFKNNLAQGTYNSTINNSINKALGTIPSTPNPNEQNTQGGNPRTTSTTSTTESSSLVYPIDMGKTKQDRIKFTAVEYLPSGNLNNLEISFQDRKTIRKGKSVFLPIQASITDQNSVDWQGGNLNYIDQQLINLSGGVVNAKSYEELVGGVSKSLAQAFSDIKSSSNEIKVALAEQAVGVTGLLGRFGTVLNPNLELLFTGPQLRPFEFQFKMSAREQAEANVIKEIIKFFKQNMAPRVKDGEVFLKAPYTFFIEYQYGNPDPKIQKLTEHQGINKIKECALLNCAVDYTPNGTYMTYQDGTMVSYTLSLSFQELEPIYSRDYDAHSIGY